MPLLAGASPSEKTVRVNIVPQVGERSGAAENKSLESSCSGPSGAQLQAAPGRALLTALGGAAAWCSRRARSSCDAGDRAPFNGFYHRSAASAWIRKHLKITSGRCDAVFEPAPANRVSVGHKPVGDSHCGEKRTLRDSISLPQLVFLPRAEIAGNAAIFSPR